MDTNEYSCVFFKFVRSWQSVLFLQLKFYITVQQSPVLKKRDSSRMIPEILLILFF